MSRFHNAPDRSKPLLDAFHEKYVKGLHGDCWVWIASLMKTGYGQINTRDGRTVTAHRFSYMIHKGEIPDGMFVCHTCDNRACVNPDHLWLGTPKDNIHDMYRKGRAVHRSPRGEDNAAAKLTEENVRLIFTSSRPHADLAKEFGVTNTCIYAIKIGKSWRHVTEKLGDPHAPSARKLTEADARAIFLDERKQCDIAKDYNVQPNLISRIKSGKRWNHVTKNLRNSAYA